LCFTIAIIHLSIARIWSAVSKFPSTTAISDVGWLLILWGMYFMANYFVLNMALPPITKFLLSVGGILALIFMAPLKEAFSTVPKQIIPFFLSFIGAFTDIVSYIRLFAVGLATVAVADATNAMVIDLPLIAKVIVLTIGHTLNLILAAMAILVHGIRLNVLEFSGHLSLEWTGFKYSPFRHLKNV
jgi:V/A-type H+-transporting ATPase subunit I